MRNYFSAFFIFCLGFSNSISQLGNQDYFPIAVWLQTPSRAQAYKDAGINLYIGLWNELNQSQLDDLKRAGMYVICKQNEFCLNNLNESSIIAWIQEDEPDNAQWNASTKKYDPCINPEDIISYYNELKSKDPSRPVYLNLGKGVSHLKWGGRGTCTGNIDLYKEVNNGYISGSDIISFDIYPVNDNDTTVSEKLWYVPKGIDSLKSWSVKTRPTWCWIETTKINSTSNRKPTPEEVKAEVWMSIIHGANGIGYFCHVLSPNFDEPGLLHDSIMIKTVSEINSSITSLASVLNSPSINDFVEVASSNPQIPVDIMTKYLNGNYYIFAIAMRPGETEATFKISTNNTSGEVEVINEDRNLNVVDGIFKDTFSNYNIRIYKLSSSMDVSQKDNPEFEVFPNPADSYINVDLRKIETELRSVSAEFDGEIRIYNAFGKCVKNLTPTLSKGEGVLRVDVSDLVTGVYYLKSGASIKKFMVLR